MQHAELGFDAPRSGRLSRTSFPSLLLCEFQTVQQAVRLLIEQLAPGGGFILSDSNSVPYYCLAENVIAMARAARMYGGSR